MKKYLLPDEGQFFKSNLHCHSTVSDGALTPAQIKEEYQSRGYSIVAYTDHEFMIPHHELTDDDFLALVGYEMGINETNPDKYWTQLRDCHLCLIALDPSVTEQVCWNDDYVWWNNKPEIRAQVRFRGDGGYVRNHTPEEINEIIRIAKNNGFFVTYNHPVWSRHTAVDYLAFHGMHAMEIYNHGGFLAGYDDYVPRAYEEMLLGGKRIYCIATDDNHNHHPKNSPRWDSGGGFTMIKAEKLEYATITQAMLDGHFYASQGPEIKKLWFEDGEIHIACSAADRIKLNYSGRRTEVVSDIEGGGITQAVFKLNSEEDFFRLTVTDKNGKHAHTNAYFIKELFE